MSRYGTSSQSRKRKREFFQKGYDPVERFSISAAREASKKDLISSHQYQKNEYYKDHQAVREEKDKSKTTNANYEAWLAYLYLKCTCLYCGFHTHEGVNQISVFILSQKGVEKDRHPLAYYNLAMCYFFGIENLLERDLLKVRKLLWKGANLGNSDSQSILATWCLNGYHVQKNIQAAINLFQTAIAQGDPYAQYYLALSYDKKFGEEKEGLKKNVKEACRLYRLAAQQGMMGAAYNLALYYDYLSTKSSVVKDGDGRPRADINEARFLYQFAALKGHVLAKTRFDLT